jgi:hypothetical protein
MRGIETFVGSGGRRSSALDEILGRIRTHFVGRVVTLAAATAFSALLSVALLPLTTQHLQASDYGLTVFSCRSLPSWVQPRNVFGYGVKNYVDPRSLTWSTFA